MIEQRVLARRASAAEWPDASRTRQELDERQKEEVRHVRDVRLDAAAAAERPHHDAAVVAVPPAVVDGRRRLGIVSGQ